VFVDPVTTLWLQPYNRVLTPEMAVTLVLMFLILAVSDIALTTLRISGISCLFVCLFVAPLFKFVISSDMMMINNELERTWKNTSAACF
jgi:multisubunit Na+/H+ antiporter MnhG subunit